MSEPSQSRARRTRTHSSRPMRRRHHAKHSPTVAFSPPAAFQANTAQGSGSAVKMQSARNGSTRLTAMKSTRGGKSQVRQIADQRECAGDQHGERRQAQIREHVQVIVNAPERAVGLHQDPPKNRCFRASHRECRLHRAAELDVRRNGSAAVSSL